MKFKTTGSNYNKFLTIILVIGILGILILAVVWIYSEYRQYSIESDAEKIIEEFEDQFKDDNIYNVILEDEVAKNIEPPVENNEGSQQTTPSKTSVTNKPTTNKTSTNKTPTAPQKKKYKGYVMAGYIQIPRTGVRIPILESVSTKAMNVAVGKLMGPELNEPGNVVILGHNFKNRTLFSRNSRIQIGDKIYITDYTGKKLTYIVYNKYTTNQDEADYMTRDTEGRIEISLSTCTDNDEERLIIWARVE